MCGEDLAHGFVFVALLNIWCLQFLKKWKKKCDDDSETSNWISANTKVENGLFSRETAVG